MQLVCVHAGYVSHTLLMVAICGKAIVIKLGVACEASHTSDGVATNMSAYLLYALTRRLHHSQAQ